MYKIGYKPQFLRQYKKLLPEVQEEVKERIDILKKDPKHPFLKTHKLKGDLKNFWSCSVNYAYRIVFQFHDTKDSQEITLHFVGNHKIYE